MNSVLLFWIRIRDKVIGMLMVVVLMGHSSQVF